jgi:uncharacterized protein YkwD
MSDSSTDSREPVVKVRALLAAGALLVLAAVLPASAESVPPPGGYAATGSWQLLAEVNAYRRSRGLTPLKVDPRLQQTARAWAERMAGTTTLSHDDPLFSSASHRRLGLRLIAENVGFDLTVAAQHKAFLASPHHRANLEIPSLRVAGVAVVRDRAGHLWSVEDFGAPTT